MSGAKTRCDLCGMHTRECIVANYWQCPCESKAGPAVDYAAKSDISFNWCGDRYYYPDDQPTLTGVSYSTVNVIPSMMNGDIYRTITGNWVLWDVDPRNGRSLFRAENALSWWDFDWNASVWSFVYEPATVVYV